MSMDKLKQTWLTDHLVDFEYKKYILLSYLKNVRNKFRRVKLYPELTDLIAHYNNLHKYKNNKELIREQFPKRLTSLDLKKLKMHYKLLVKDDNLMEELDQIIDFSIPQINKSIQEGCDIYDFVEENIEFDVVGIMPIYKKEGYILLCQESKDVKIYRYDVKLINHEAAEYRAISTTHVMTYTQSFTNSYRSIKMKLVKKFKELPNPATFAFNSKLSLPENETLLPIVKRLLMKKVKFE